MNKQQSTIKYFWQVTYAHTIAYFVAGVFAIAFVNYKEVFGADIISSFMRPIDEPIVALGGSVLQVLRGMILALILLPLRKTFFEEKHGLRKLGILLFGLSFLIPIGPAPGSFEGLIYTKIPLAYQMCGYPEAIMTVLSFIGIMWVSINYGHKKIVKILPIVIMALICLMGIMGYFAEDLKALQAQTVGAGF